MAGTSARKADSDRGRTYMFNNGWTSHIPADMREALLARSTWRHFDPGDVITNAGDNSAGLFGVAAGTATFCTALGPTDTRLGTIFHPGEWFGIGPLLIGGRRTAKMVARERCLIAHAEAPMLERLLADHPGWWRHIGQFAGYAIAKATGVAADLMIRDSRRRCLASLLRAAGCRTATSAAPVQAIITQDELAAIANLSRNSVNTILRRTAAAGLLTLGYSSIALLDPDALRAIVDEG